MKPRLGRMGFLPNASAERLKSAKFLHRRGESKGSSGKAQNPTAELGVGEKRADMMAATRVM